MIRILHSVSNMDRAGIETMLMNYYRHIDRTKIQFDFLCNRTKPGTYDEEIKSLGGNIFHTPGLNPFKYISYLKYMKKLFKLHPEYKIIHAHNGAFIVYPLLAAKINKVPVRISHVHSSSFTHDYKKPLKILCKPFIPCFANYYIACGKVAAEFYYGNKRVNNKMIKIINNAIEPEKFIFNEKIRNTIRKKHGLDKKVVIGHVGRFDIQKNHKFLIDIFSEIKKKEKNAVLVLLGDGELQNKIKEKVESLGLTNDVFFEGNVDNINEWYQAMDVLVLPSISEGLPVVGVEAQASDLPCVFSDDVTKEINFLPTTKYIRRDESIEHWVDAILAYAYNYKRKDTSKIIREAGFDIDIEASKLLHFYEKIIEDFSIK